MLFDHISDMQHEQHTCGIYSCIIFFYQNLTKDLWNKKEEANTIL